MAQGVADSLHRRNDCRLAAQTLTTGHPAPRRLWALQTITSCPSEAGQAVSVAWQMPPADTESLNWLVAASVGSRDARIYDGVARTAQATTLPRLARLSALRVLASYAEPNVWVSFADLISQ